MSIRSSYVTLGAKEFYLQEGDVYRNPHEPQLKKALGAFLSRHALDFSKVLDYGCGSGEVTEILKPYAQQIYGSDPYTYKNYENRTGKPCYQLGFEQVASLPKSSLVVASYCLHLLEPSKLPNFLYELSQKTETLLIISPHKKPVINSPYWSMVAQEYSERVRIRLFSAIL